MSIAILGFSKTTSNALNKYAKRLYSFSTIIKDF